MQPSLERDKVKRKQIGGLNHVKEAYTELTINKSHQSHRTRALFMPAEVLQIVLPAEYVKEYTTAILNQPHQQ